MTTPVSRQDPSSSDDNFRVRAAREKRKRMRARLLEATLDVYQPGGKGGVAVIDDVVKKAGVSRGTFYKYFVSLEEAINCLGEQLAETSILEYQQIYGHINDNLSRVAGGTVSTLARAAMEPRWGMFVSNVDYIDQLSERSPLKLIITEPLLAARANQQLVFNNTEAAIDLLIGTAIEATKRLAHGQQQTKSYISELAQLCMMGLGLERAVAAATVEAAWQQLQHNHHNLTWWRTALSD